MKKTKSKKGLFITFEGIDGCGKTTQAVHTYRYLLTQGYKVKLLREPGSTETAEKIREILLNKKLSINNLTELLLYEAARAEITSKEIAPELAKGNVVICDRFYDSTTAYQGYGRKLDIQMVRALNKIAVGNLTPDLTLLFDVDLKTGLSRRDKNPDRLEMQTSTFFKRVRKGFLEIARKDRKRIKVIDGSVDIDSVFEEVLKTVTRKLRYYESTTTKSG